MNNYNTQIVVTLSRVVFYMFVILYDFVASYLAVLGIGYPDTYLGGKPDGYPSGLGLLG